MGKTTYLIRYVKNSSYRQYFIFDHKHEFQAREGILPFTDSQEMLEAFIRGEKYISYSPIDEYPGDEQAAFEWFCRWVYNIVRQVDTGEYLFVCDEVNTFTDAYNAGQSFNQIIKDGRLWGIDFAGTAHAGNQINNRLRMQLSEVVTFHIEDETAVKFLVSLKFNEDEIYALRKGEFILKDCNQGIFERGHLFKLTPVPKNVDGQPTNQSNKKNEKNLGPDHDRPDDRRRSDPLEQVHINQHPRLNTQG